MVQIRKVLVLGTSLALLTSCASVIHGRKQKISVLSMPSGAAVIVQNVRVGTTPAEVKVRRKEKRTILRFEKDGYNSVDVVLARKVSSWAWGNIAIGGVTGLIIDFADGAAYEQTPDQVDVTMQELLRTDSVSFPGKDTILVVFREKTAGERIAGERIDE